MHQRNAAIAAWEAAGIRKKVDRQLQEFFTYFEMCKGECWPTLVPQARAGYANYKATLANPLWNSGDKLLRLNLIRAADLSQPDELRLVSQFAATCNPATDGPEIRALVETGNATILAAVAKLPGLAPNVLLTVNQQLARIPPAAPAPPGVAPPPAAPPPPAATPGSAKAPGRAVAKRVAAKRPRAGGGRSQAPN